MPDNTKILFAITKEALVTQIQDKLAAFDQYLDELRSTDPLTWPPGLPYVFNFVSQESKMRIQELEYVLNAILAAEDSASLFANVPPVHLASLGLLPKVDEDG